MTGNSNDWEMYKIANDNRKFEIENYWKRANYFWLFQVTAYTGYFVALGYDDRTDFLLAIIAITCLGFLTALAWYFTNRGSKVWQEYWENRVGKIEEKIKPKENLYNEPVGERWSVSRVNELVSLLSIGVWVLLGVMTILMFAPNSLVFLAYALVLVLIYCVFAFWGRSGG